MQLPNVIHFNYQLWPEEGALVEFRLIYRGPLPAQGSGTGSRISEKREIGMRFLPQLRELWKHHPILSEVWLERGINLEQVGSKFERAGFLFLPLVSKARGIACSLDILFLRRDGPGNLIVTGGDIDNRIKTLFDALRMPHEEELNNIAPADGERPFFCLLEDDALVTDVRVTTDRLLEPLGGDERIHDVHLVVHVKTKIVDDRIASRWWA